MAETNWIDRAIGYVAPGYALRRELHRDLLLSYRGGVGTRTDRPGLTRDRSMIGGRSSERANLANMRDRARRAYRDNAIARSLLDTETDSVIADGFTLQARTTDSEFNRRVEEAWNRWVDAADIRGMMTGAQWQRQAWLEPRKDGDGGFLLVDRGGESRLQYIPGDLIRNPDKRLGGASVEQPTIFDGVETNTVGRPVAFHVLSEDELGRRDFTRVTAQNFVWLSHREAPLSVRGVTCYAPIFGLLDQVDGYVDAVVIAARMAAVFGLIIKESTAAKQYGGLQTLANVKGDQQRALTLENGSVKYMGVDGDVVQVQAQQPMQQTPDFIRAMMRLIGQPFQMPLELVLKDVSQANLSSLRGARQDYHRHCLARQEWFRKTCLSRIYQWWLSREAATGRIEVPATLSETYWTHQFMPRGWAFTDPVTEAQAALLEIDMGIQSPQGVAAGLGRDFETLQQQIREAREMRDGLPDIRSTYTRDPSQQMPGAKPAQEPTTTPDPGEPQ